MSGVIPDFLTLPGRPSKPREVGITHVMDKGLSVREAADLVETSGEYVDIVKLGWGTGYVSRNLPEKIRIYEEGGISVVLGGTFWEVCLAQNSKDEGSRFRDPSGHIRMAGRA